MSDNKRPPFDIVVIGATGDLARRKLVPALYYLDAAGELADDGRIFGVARQELSDDLFFRGVERAMREDGAELDPGAWARFCGRLAYLGFSATDSEAYAGLAEALRGREDHARVFYLATSPELYGDIANALAQAGLITASTRLVLEKPIGHDLSSAKAINDAVGRVASESQIYRIDHYLGKETVQNLMAVRFGNVLFEPLWRSERIDHVQITVAETLGVEGRGAYYDNAGALRDMVQNHLLQLLCLTAMEPPSHLEQDAIRQEKIKVLRSLRPIGASEVAQKTVRAQYRAGSIDGHSVPGYLEETGISADSTTETFVALKVEVDNWRWAGVPFYLRTGKRMGHQVSEIVIQFKPVPHLLFRDQAGTIQDNRLVIRLQPHESIKLGMMVKRPGPHMALKPTFLNLNLHQEGVRTPLAYERLLLDVIRGVTTLFMHRSEVEEAWRFCEPILDGWAEHDSRPRQYAAGSWGPAESIALVVRDDRSWLEQVV